MCSCVCLECQRKSTISPLTRFTGLSTPLRGDTSSQGILRKGRLAIAIMINFPNSKMQFWFEELENMLVITLRWQPVTPSAQSQPWPREGNVKYPTRETLTCRHRRCTTPKNFYIVTLCKVASAFIPFSLPNLKCCTFCVFLILLNKYRVESKAKDDFKFPVMVEDGKHSCTEVNSLNINSLFSSL